MLDPYPMSNIRPDTDFVWSDFCCSQIIKS